MPRAVAVEGRLMLPAAARSFIKPNSDPNLSNFENLTCL